MESTRFNKYKQAADIINNTLNEAKKLCNDKNMVSFICNYCDNYILENLNKLYKKLNKGISLPTCLSINNIIAHNSYYGKNDYKIKDGDVIRIEMACHIDNNVATVGDTIKIGDINWVNNPIMIAAQKALDIGIMTIEPKQLINKYIENINKVCDCFDLNLVKRPNVFYEDDTIIFFDWVHRDTDNFNEPSWVVVKDHELELEDSDISEEELDKNLDFTIGEAYHLIVTITTSKNIPKVSEEPSVLYQNTKNRYNLRCKYSRELISNVIKNYDTEIFKLSNINMSESRIKLGLKECLDHGVIRGLGLIELNNCETVQLKCTVIIQNNTVYKLTGNKISKLTHAKLTPELNKILKQSFRFDNRESYWDIL